MPFHKKVIDILKGWTRPEGSEPLKPAKSASEAVDNLIDVLPEFSKDQRTALFNYVFRGTRESRENSEGLKSTLIFLHNANRSLELKDYIAAYAHIRLSAEAFAQTVIEFSMLSSKELGDDQFSKLKAIQERGLLSAEELKVMHTIRILGNNALHKGVADRELAPSLLKQFQAVVQNWVED